MRIFLSSLLLAASVAVPASAQTLDRIRETGEIKLGYRIDAAPLSFQRADGNPAGFTPEICVFVAKYIAKHLELKDMEAVFVPVDTQDRFDKVASGEIDLLCGAATITLKRREKVDFSVPIFIDGTSAMFPKDAELSLTSLAGKKAGARSGTTTLEALTNSLKAAEVDAEIVEFGKHADGVTALEKGEISAYFADQSILFGLKGTHPGVADMQILGEILTFEKQGLALARGDSDFRLVVDTAISEIFTRNIIDKVFEATLPGVKPGLGMQAIAMTSPTLP